MGGFYVVLNIIYYRSILCFSWMFFGFEGVFNFMFKVVG